MMKHIAIVTFFLFAFIHIKAQRIIQFKGYLKSSCSIIAKELKEYSLRKGTFYYYSLNSGIVANLPDTGSYVLESSSIAVEGDSVIVHINVGLNVDTIKQKDIVDMIFLDSKPLKGMSQGGGWFCCGKPCNGYQVDYYDNGNKRMEGKFKNGKVIGELKFYNSSGQLDYIEHYNKKGKKIKNQWIINTGAGF